MLALVTAARMQTAHMPVPRSHARATGKTWFKYDTNISLKQKSQSPLKIESPLYHSTFLEQDTTFVGVYLVDQAPILEKETPITRAIVTNAQNADAIYWRAAARSSFAAASDSTFTKALPERPKSIRATQTSTLLMVNQMPNRSAQR
jgi:hypothetical protein